MKAFTVFDSIESLYRALDRCEEIKAKALLMLMLRNWLTEVSSFDPVSGHALHTGIIDLLDVVAKTVLDDSPESEIKDRIYRIVSHTKEAVLAIMKHTRDKIMREHAMLPIHAAREVDSKSVQWLSRQPGRTLREKLSGKPYMKAVRRRTSVDTAENRLLRAFLFRLEQILIERQNILSASTEDNCGELLVPIQRWLRTEDAAEIGEWGNLPPNNTLLQDKRYRKVWDGWLWLQAIDEQITEDSKRIHRDILSFIYWNTLSILNYSGRFRTVQQPVGLDYDNFAISPELPVRGYLFPDNSNTKISGAIDRLVSDREFGFIDGCFFHASDLMAGLRFDELQIGDQLLFDVEETVKGKCAKRLEKGFRKPPRQFMFELLNEQINISVDEETISILVDREQIVLGQKNKGVKKKLKIEPTTLKEIPKTILSLVADAPFEYSAPTNNQSRPIRIDSSVVDLCSIRPTFTNNTGSQAHLPFRLLQQIWSLKNDDSKQVIDCGTTKSIAFHPNVETISMRSLFSPKSTLPDATRSSASMFFTKKLSNYIKTNKLTYLIPDWGNDFDLEGIRKSVNFYFEDSTPLPKSIAAIFSWQSSAGFSNCKLSSDSEVLVIDSFYGGFSVTPLTVQLSDELKKKLPLTRGIHWERHPTFVILNDNILEEIKQKLDQMNCPFPEEVIQLFGLDGLLQEVDQFTFENGKNPFHVPFNIKNIFKIKKSRSDVQTKKLNKFLNSKKNKNIYILPLRQSVIIDQSLSRFTNISVFKGFSLTKGVLTLNKWQEEVDDIALWRDHLPELSIRIVRDGHFENFYLVKDATVTPKRGKTVNIPVAESFILPAGQMHYSFPLQQGEGNKELQFVAYLKSPAFPLKKATACKLKMTYTYGADDPYELKFIPLDIEKAGFKSIRVEWRSASERETADLENLPVPDFPARKSWSDFQKFPKEDGKSFSDLLDWIERDLLKIADLSYYGRVSGVIPKWIDKGDDNVFCFIDDMFIHKSSLYLEKSLKLPQQGEILSFYKIKDNKGRFLAKDVTLGRTLPKGCFLSKSLRFPTLTIWNHGHSLSESDVPDHFRNAVFEGTQKIISIIESENMPDTLKEELFFFLCCLHKDAPEIVGTRLLEAVKHKKLLRRYHRNIAFAIGNAELPWQQELLKHIINPVDNDPPTGSITMEVLSIALWRSKTLINKLTKEELRALSRNLFGFLECDLLKVINNRNRCQIGQIAIFCKHLELLLALLRSRKIEDEGVKKILAPDNELTQKYVTLVDDVSRVVIEKNIQLKSRISLQIEKPEMFRNTPDLLYALWMYLTGDSGANSIIISGIVEDS